MAISPDHRKVLGTQAVGGLVLNALLNGATAWVGFPLVTSLPLWSRGNCVAADTIGTSFFLPLTTCLIITPISRRAARRDPAVTIPRDDLPWATRWLPANMVARGALVGLISALSAAPIALGLLTAAGVVGMTRAEDVMFKAVYTAILGAIVTPLLGLRALADTVK